MNISKVARSTRPPFLILAPICVFYGVAIARFLGQETNYIHFILALIGGVLSAISVNTLNEYQDYQSGLDKLTNRTPFSGGSGLLIEQPQLATDVFKLFILSTVVTIGIGSYFLFVASPFLLIVGLLGLVIIFTYTKWLNKSPILCLLAPGAGFGILMVCGSYLTQATNYYSMIVPATLIPFFLINNLLLLNQFPDIDADKTAGRNHFPIKYGCHYSSYVFILFNVLTAATIVYLIKTTQLSSIALVCLVPVMANLCWIKNVVTLGKNIATKPAVMAFNVIAANATPFMLALFFWFN